MFLSDHYGPWARSELKDADKYINRMERVFQRALDMPMSDLNSAWVERWWMERLQTKARPDGEGLITKAIAWRDLASFRAVIAKAVKWGMLEQNLIQQLRMKAAKPRSVVRFLSPAEEQRLRGALTARDIDHAAARRSANEWRAARP